MEKVPRLFYLFTFQMLKVVLKIRLKINRQLRNQCAERNPTPINQQVKYSDLNYYIYLCSMLLYKLASHLITTQCRSRAKPVYREELTKHNMPFQWSPMSPIIFISKNVFLRITFYDQNHFQQRPPPSLKTTALYKVMLIGMLSIQLQQNIVHLGLRLTVKRCALKQCPMFRVQQLTTSSLSTLLLLECG